MVCMSDDKADPTANTVDACDVVFDEVDWQQPEELPEGEPLWPIGDDQHPEIVNSVGEFLDAMIYQTHIDRVVVLPNGIKLLKQEHAMPERFHRAVSTSRTVRDFLYKIIGEGKDDYRARLWHYTEHGAEREIKDRGKSKLLVDKIAAMKEGEAEGTIGKNAPIYVSEIRNTQKTWHPIAKDEFVKTATLYDVYDYTPLARRMPLWERSEGGIFVGERGTGSGFHIDQCMWDNVGRNWCGYKLFAIWPWEDRFSILGKVPKGRMFHIPLSNEDIDALSRAKKIALLRPGDVFCFSGAQPHTALCVGDGINISAYESYVPAHSEAVGTLVRSNIKNMHPKMFWMDDEDLDELYEDVVDNLQRALRDSSIDSKLRSRLEACVMAMRERGDAYCRELWQQEDSNRRRRRREDGSSSSSSNYSPSRSDGEGDDPQPPRTDDFDDSGDVGVENCENIANLNGQDAKAAVNDEDNEGPKPKKVRGSSEACVC